MLAKMFCGGASALLSIALLFASSAQAGRTTMDYNVVPVPLFDQLMNQPLVSNVYSHAVYQGTTDAGAKCEVKLSRLSSPWYNNTSFFHYQIEITTPSASESEQQCSAKLEMGSDLDVNSDSQVAYKGTYATPRFLSSAWEKGQIVKSGAHYRLYCHNFSKEGRYRIGWDKENNCNL